MDGAQILTGHGRDHHSLSPGGELVLGQSFLTVDNQKQFDLKKAYLGEMGFVNIWQRVLTPLDIRDIATDCFFSACGDAVEWADFRSGTRGAMKMRWPAHIKGEDLYIIKYFGQYYPNLN